MSKGQAANVHVQSWMIQSLVPFPARSDVGNPIRSHVTGGPLGRLLGPIALSVAKPWENRWPEDSNSANTEPKTDHGTKKKSEHHDLKQLEVIFPHVQPPPTCPWSFLLSPGPTSKQGATPAVLAHSIR